MDENSSNLGMDDGEEYVMLDLSAVTEQIDIPPNAPYVLSGLDTLNPILTIDDKIKLIGEYEETIGTCLVFSEDGAAADSSLAPNKQVRPVASLHKVLKFRLLADDDDTRDITKS